MPPPSVCRLCANKCLNIKKLYKENGHCSYECDLMQKYVNSSILNLELAKHLTVICSQCWHHILEFHNFQQCVILAQKKLTAEAGKVERPTDLVAKPEVKHGIITITVDEVADPATVAKPEVKHGTITITDKDVAGPTTVVHQEVVLDTIPTTVKEDVPVLEENHVQVIELENDPLLAQGNPTNVDNNTNTLNEDSDDPLTVFLGFDERRENALELIDVHSSHSSDVEMVETPNTDDESPKPSQSKASPVKATQSLSPATLNTKTTSRRHLTSYRRTTDTALDAVVYAFMPNISCVECHKAFTSYSSIRSHFLTQHPNLEFYVKCCNLKLKTRGCVEGHFRNHKSPRSFKCDLCDKAYSLKKYLNVHVMQCHPEIRHARTHNCPNCKQAFALQYFLKLHMKTCNGKLTPQQAPGTSSQFFQGEEGDYYCNICEKVCTNIVALRKHTWYHHRADYKHKCSFCDRSFQQRVEWREHEAIQHTGEHLYACPNCPNTFLRRSWLLNHQKELHGIKSAKSCCSPPDRCPMHSQTNINSE